MANLFFIFWTTSVAELTSYSCLLEKLIAALFTLIMQEEPIFSGMGTLSWKLYSALINSSQSLNLTGSASTFFL